MRASRYFADGEEKKVGTWRSILFRRRTKSSSRSDFTFYNYENRLLDLYCVVARVSCVTRSRCKFIITHADLSYVNVIRLSTFLARRSDHIGCQIHRWPVIFVFVTLLRRRSGKNIARYTLFRARRSFCLARYVPIATPPHVYIYIYAQRRL